MPGERYFGNTLTDLQAALTARDRLAAEQNIASQGNMVRFTQGMQQFGAQRAALQQQAMQQGEQNRLAQQQMAQADYFNRGRLQNEEARIAAELEAAKAQNAATMEWRKAALQPQVDRATAATEADAQAAALLATQSENLAKARTEHERLTADLSKLTAMEAAQSEQNKLPNPPGMFARSGLRPDLYDPGAFKQEATTAGGRSLGGVNFAGAKQRIQQQLDTLTEYIKGNGELNTTLAKQPDGSWVSTLRPIIGGTSAPAFFGAPRTQAVTNGAPYFNPTATNAPSVEGPMPAPMNPAQRQVGVVYQTPRGPLRWTAAGWMPL